MALGHLMIGGNAFLPITFVLTLSWKHHWWCDPAKSLWRWSWHLRPEWSVAIFSFRHLTLWSGMAGVCQEPPAHVSTSVHLPHTSTVAMVSSPMLSSGFFRQ